MTGAVWIVAAKRTPHGRFLGALAKHSAVDLAVAAGGAALADAGAAAADVDLVILGNVLGAGLGQNAARQVGVRLGVPLETPAFSVNMMCASGMQAVILAAQAVRGGEAEVVLCGGAESMSNAPYLLDRARSGYKLGDGVLIDSLLHDGLTDAFDRQHMGHGAEALARQHGISREDQDRFALSSQQRCDAAVRGGRFDDELAAVGDVTRDEHPRPDTLLENLAALKPAFTPDGTVTAGNASGINDGAAMLLVCGEEAARRRGWRPLAAIGAAASAGCEPRLFGMGPVHATRRLCRRCGTSASDFDTVELNEAFAAQALACVRALELDEARVNPEGGAIALGHPIGASGARLITHLAHRIRRGESRRALATLCVGGGMGTAVALEAAAS